MYVPRRRSSLSQEVANTSEAFGDDDSADEATDTQQKRYALESDCFNCRVTNITKPRRRSSSSFKVGPIIDSLLADRTSASKSEPINFSLEVHVSDYSFHIAKGGRPPKAPKRLQFPMIVQYVEWKDNNTNNNNNNNNINNSNIHNTPFFASPTLPSSSFPLVGNVNISQLYRDRPKFPGFQIPHKSTLQVAIGNTESTTVSISLLSYDLSRLALNHKRILRYKNKSIVIQLVLLNYKRKFYLADILRLVMFSKQDMMVSNQWEITTLSESFFDEGYYKLCAKCQQKQNTEHKTEQKILDVPVDIQIH